MPAQAIQPGRRAWASRSLWVLGLSTTRSGMTVGVQGNGDLARTRALAKELKKRKPAALV